MQILNHPIMWQQLNALRHADAVKRFSYFSDQMSEQGKSDFDRGMIVGARQVGLIISETAHLLGFSRKSTEFAGYA